MKTATIRHDPKTDLGIIPAFFDHAPVGILVHRRGDCLYANEALAHLLGYESVEAFRAAGDCQQHTAPASRRSVQHIIRYRTKGEHGLLAQSQAGDEVPVRGMAFDIELEDGRARLAYVSEDSSDGWCAGWAADRPFPRFSVRQDLPDHGIVAGSEVVPMRDGGVRIVRWVRDEDHAAQIVADVLLTGPTEIEIERGHLKLIKA